MNIVATSAVVKVQSPESLHSCNAYLAKVLSSIETLKLELDRLKEVSKYTPEIKKRIQKIEREIEQLSTIRSEVEKMLEFSPGVWVKNGSTRPGQVIDLVIAGQIPEVHVLWSGNTVPVPERPMQLTLLDKTDIEYVWNGDRFPKLVRRIDQHECDEVARLQTELTTLLDLKKIESDDSELLRQITYCRKRIGWVNSQDLERLERTIRQGLEIFYRVGDALAEIRDRKLYKDLGYSNFEDYCIERWNMKRRYADRLIKSASVVNNLIESKSESNWTQNKPTAYQLDDKPSEKVISAGHQIPSSEAVAREVGKVPQELQEAVWDKAVEIYGDNPTASNVKEIVKQMNCPDKDVPDDKRTGNQKLALEFEVGQLVKLQLSNMSGIDEDLRLANHGYGIIESVTQTESSLRISMLENDKSFVVLPQDIKVIKSVDICVNFTAEKFIELYSVYKSKANIESALIQGVIGK